MKYSIRSKFYQINHAANISTILYLPSTLEKQKSSKMVVNYSTPMSQSYLIFSQNLVEEEEETWSVLKLAASSSCVVAKASVKFEVWLTVLDS